MDEKVERLLERLPDPEAARRLYARLREEQPATFASLNRKEGLLANLLTLAAHSPWLGDVMLAQPDIVDWLGRRGIVDRSYTREDFLEELGRFAARRSDPDPQSMLNAFKWRELVRIYLRDCLRLATLTETTEELSHLADAVLARALAHARQELANRHGVPHTRDARGRATEADFAVVALGKLGSRELNYASDVDLMFLYSGAGQTAATGRAARTQSIDNHTFFTRLAEALVRIVGTPGTAAPVYRVDLRLRPYGRDGELAAPLERALDYYRTYAQNWERQMLIRARASAGSERLVARFLSELRPVIFRAEPLPEAVRGVRAAMERIARREVARAGGFNVKLGAGGIREIEFLTQALQLAYGGQDQWIRAPRVLVGLQRLADKGFLSDADRSALSEAYTFLRTVEHRVQMAHGAQTHRLPVDRAELRTLARRCGYDPSDPQRADPAARLERDVRLHTERVRAISSRVFSLADRPPEAPPPMLAVERASGPDERMRSTDAEARRPLETAVALLAELATGLGENSDERAGRAAAVLADFATRVPHPARALRNLDRYLASLAAARDPEMTRRALGSGAERLEQLVRLLGSGSFFSEILVAQPELAAEIPGSLFCATPGRRADFAAALSRAVDAETALAGRMAALRRAWYREIVAVGSHDVLGRCPVVTVNREQTELAEASLEVACRIARAELWRGGEEVEPRFSIQALGRLGHAGMDYGSDLDLLVVFDGEAPVPAGEEASQLYSRFAQLLVRVLSSLTREGYVYRVDFRLRPEGRAGRMASSLARLDDYLRTRASAWELTAYLKVRPVAGDSGFGALVRERVIEGAFEAAAGRERLREELREVRLGLERERARVGRNIKWGRGGMMDVYFVTRYLQLRDRVDFPPERGTRALIEHLGAAGALSAAHASALYDGYSALRGVDHYLRLVGDRLAPRLPEEAEALEEIASATGFASVGEFDAHLAHTTETIRAVFDDVV